MARKLNPVKRISNELNEEIKRISEKNGIGYTEACKEIARVIKKNRNKKVVREIKF